jgi:hypothetical protein
MTAIGKTCKDASKLEKRQGFFLGNAVEGIFAGIDEDSASGRAVLAFRNAKQLYVAHAASREWLGF